MTAVTKAEANGTTVLMAKEYAVKPSASSHATPAQP